VFFRSKFISSIWSKVRAAVLQHVCGGRGGDDAAVFCLADTLCLLFCLLSTACMQIEHCGVTVDGSKHLSI
jgi:hypothetical protein